MSQFQTDVIDVITRFKFVPFLFWNFLGQNFRGQHVDSDIIQCSTAATSGRRTILTTKFVTAKPCRENYHSPFYWIINDESHDVIGLLLCLNDRVKCWWICTRFLGNGAVLIWDLKKHSFPCIEILYCLIDYTGIQGGKKRLEHLLVRTAKENAIAMRSEPAIWRLLH